MSSSLLLALVSAFWHLTVALLLTLALRHPLRRWLGAESAYQAWLLVPVILAGGLAPSQVRSRVIEVASLPLRQMLTPTLPAPAHAWHATLLWIWLAGALLLAAWFWRSHRGFVSGLGRLTWRDGLFHSDQQFLGPALLGLWRTKLLVPRDFFTRYSPAEQRLVLRHERVHARRGDAWANLLQAMLQCLFWFNPLVHLAALLFRVDQELACDAAVIRACPGERRAYATALLKSQDISFASAVNLACRWRSIHPVKERIMNMQENQPTHLRRLAARVAIGALILASAGLALTSRAGVEAAGGASRFAVATTFDLAGKSFAPQFIAVEGENIKVRSEEGGKRLTAQFQIRKTGAANTVQITAKFDSGTATLAQPTVVSRLGEQSRIRIGTDEGPLEVSLVVTELP